MRTTVISHFCAVGLFVLAGVAWGKEAVWKGTISRDWSAADNWDNGGYPPAAAGNQGVEFNAAAPNQPIVAGNVPAAGSKQLSAITFKTAGWTLGGSGSVTVSRANLQGVTDLLNPIPHVKSSGAGENIISVPLKLVKPNSGNTQFVATPGNTLTLGHVSFVNDATSNFDLTGGGTFHVTDVVSCGDFRIGNGSLVLLDCKDGVNPLPKSSKVRVVGATLRWLKSNQACQGTNPITYLRIDGNGLADINGQNETFQQIQFALDTTEAGVIETGTGKLTLSEGTVSVGSSSKIPASTAVIRGTLAKSGGGGFTFQTRRGTQESDLVLDCAINDASSCFFQGVPDVDPGRVVMKGVYTANGKFQVSGGALRLENPGVNVFAGAEFNVNAGARLEGAAILRGVLNNSKMLTIKGVLSPGMTSGGLQIVESTLANGTKVMMPVVFKSGSTFEIPCLSEGVTNLSTEGGVTVEDGVTIDFSKIVDSSAGTFHLLHAEAGISGVFQAAGLPDGWTYTVDPNGKDLWLKVPQKGLEVIVR